MRLQSKARRQLLIVSLRKTMDQVLKHYPRPPPHKSVKVVQVAVNSHHSRSPTSDGSNSSSETLSHPSQSSSIRKHSDRISRDYPILNKYQHRILGRADARRTRRRPPHLQPHRIQSSRRTPLQLESRPGRLLKLCLCCRRPHWCLDRWPSVRL